MFELLVLVLLDILRFNSIDVQSRLGTDKNSCCDPVHYGPALANRVLAVRKWCNSALAGSFDWSCLGHFESVYVIVPFYWTKNAG